MKKFILILSLLAFVVSGVVGFSLIRPKKTAVAKPRTSPFADFQINQSKTVEITTSAEASNQLGGREYMDQVRDWLLMTVVSDAGLSPEQLNQALFDLPPVRYGYIRPVGTLEYGETRFRSVGNGCVVALIPRGNSAENIDALAQIADEALKNTGERPKKLFVFDYEISADGVSAQLTRHADIDGSALFTAENQYFESTINSLAGLHEFMSRIGDLTYARAEESSLVLGGRRLGTHHHHNITVNDVAALWSAQMKLRTKNDDFERFVNQKQVEFDSRWSHRQYYSESERIQLEQQRDTDVAQVKEEIVAERDRRGIISGIGFSLDPSFQKAKLKAVLEGRGGQFIVLSSRGAISQSEMAEAAEAAGRGNDDPFYSLLQKLPPDVARKIVSLIKVGCSYQAARYDGALKGTEVGMVLFYTDLLAKLWALDYMGSSPDKYIDGFESMSHKIVSVIYEKEMDGLQSTRLWFGVQSHGYSMKSDGSPSIMLAPVATRLYAASSDSLRPGQEAAPNAASAAFLGWWDDHYAEVARFEPEYERLNEIMKWSIVVSWLDKQGKLDLLSRLQSVQFKRDNWFPDWVKQHSDLRFQRWDKVNFYPRGYAATESLPLLQSRNDVPNPLMGGVSLAEKEIFETHGSLAADVSEFARRPTLSEAAPDIFKTADGSQYQFGRLGDSYTMNATLKAGTKFRALDAEVPNLQYSRAIEYDMSGVRIQAKNSDALIGDLSIERSASKFRISWESRDFDNATSIARKISIARDPEAALAADSRVGASIDTGQNLYLVKLRGSDKWLKIAANRDPNVAIAEGWQSRVAPIQDGAHPVDITWLGSESAAKELGESYVQIPARTESDGIRMKIAARPPPGASGTDVHLAGRTFSGFRDGGSGDYYVKWSDVPTEVRERPEMLRLSAGTASSPGGGVPPSFDDLANGRFDRAADDLVHSPLGFKMALDQHYVVGLKSVDQMIARGNDKGALQALEVMRVIHGDTPEIAIRRAIALTREANPERVANTLDEAARMRIRDRGSLFDEINARIKNSHTPEEQDNLLRVAEFGDWNDLQNTGILKDGTPTVKVSDGKLQIDFNAHSKLNGNPVKDVSSENGLFYIQDSPALASLDSPASVQQAIHNGVNGHIPYVLKLNEEDIAFFRPAKIYVDDDHVTLNKVTHSKETVRSSYRSFNSNNNGPCTAGDSRPECQQQKQPVYLVVDNDHTLKTN